MSWIAKFKDVGRGKAGWTQSFDFMPTSRDLEMAIKEKKVLASKGVEVVIDGLVGQVFAGFHQVGVVGISEEE